MTTGYLTCPECDGDCLPSTHVGPLDEHGEPVPGADAPWWFGRD